MSRIILAAYFILNAVVLVAVTSSVAVSAAESVAPVRPAPPAKVKPYQLSVQSDVTAAYGYRTRILAGKPECQHFAAESDAVFLNEKMDSAAKEALLVKIGDEASAKGCLAP